MSKCITEERELKLTEELPAVTPEAAVRRSKLLAMLQNNKAVPVQLLKDHMNEAGYLRAKALQMAQELALKANYFQTHYDTPEEVFDDMEFVYELADRNLEYIRGEK